jgi:hypothetical protein
MPAVAPSARIATSDNDRYVHYVDACDRPNGSNPRGLPPSPPCVVSYDAPRRATLGLVGRRCPDQGGADHRPCRRGRSWRASQSRQPSPPPRTSTSPPAGGAIESNAPVDRRGLDQAGVVHRPCRRPGRSWRASQSRQPAPPPRTSTSLPAGVAIESNGLVDRRGLDQLVSGRGRTR